MCVCVCDVCGSAGTLMRQYNYGSQGQWWALDYLSLWIQSHQAYVASDFFTHWAISLARIIFLYYYPWLYLIIHLFNQILLIAGPHTWYKSVLSVSYTTSSDCICTTKATGASFHLVEDIESSQTKWVMKESWCFRAKTLSSPAWQSSSITLLQVSF